MRIFIITTFAFFSAISFLSSTAQNKLELDRESIKAMCGCFEVTFKYAETFSPDSDYVFHENHQSFAPAEYVFVIEETKNKFVLQHLLVAGDSNIIKHWRQDWIFENTAFWQYTSDNFWKYTIVPAASVRGQWTQKVYQVDDSPRYQGTGSWLHVDGKHYWESISDSPLPRREFTIRDDYNILRRGNRHEITEYGWMHIQDNVKIKRDSIPDRIISEEKGRNYYVRIPDENCDMAKEWWSRNAKYWELVRSEWNKTFLAGADLKLHKKIDDLLLWQSFFALESEMNSTTDADMITAIRETISKYRF